MTDEHDEMESFGTEDSQVPEPEPVPKLRTDEEKPCMTCELDEAITTFALTNMACQFAEKSEDKKACAEWASGLDPEAVEDLDRIVDETIDRVGIDGLSKMSQSLNNKMHSGIIRHVQKRLDSGEEVPSNVMNLYKSLSIKRGL